MRLTEQQIARVTFLENERGQITAELVLADAKREDSPLNSLFDWDLTKAAHTAWLDRAREVIRTVRIVVTTEVATFRAPFYVRDPNAKQQQGYVAVTALQRSPESAREALISELTRAAGNIARAKSLAAVLDLTSDMDVLMDQILHVKQRIDLISTPGEDTAGGNIAV